MFWPTWSFLYMMWIHRRKVSSVSERMKVKRAWNEGKGKWWIFFRFKLYDTTRVTYTFKTRMHHCKMIAFGIAYVVRCRSFSVYRMMMIKLKEYSKFTRGRTRTENVWKGQAMLLSIPAYRHMHLSLSHHIFSHRFHSCIWCESTNNSS